MAEVETRSPTKRRRSSLLASSKAILGSKARRLSTKLHKNNESSYSSLSSDNGQAEEFSEREEAVESQESVPCPITNQVHVQVPSSDLEVLESCPAVQMVTEVGSVPEDITSMQEEGQDLNLSPPLLEPAESSGHIDLCTQESGQSRMFSVVNFSYFKIQISLDTLIWLFFIR